MLGSLIDAALDRTIVFSFDRNGFARHRRAFRADDLNVDLRGRVAIVTGANSGLGLAAAQGIARLGAEVWLACRREAAGADAAAAIRAAVPGARVHDTRLDVSDLADVRRFVDQLPCRRVDLLVNNAGVLPERYAPSPQGLELTLATNLVGPFLLTELLLPRFATAADPRVVLVSSGGMYGTRLDVASLEPAPDRFDGVAAYAQTKRAQVVLAELWAARHPSITFSAMHPGWADTPALQASLPRFHWLTSRILRTAEEGADTMVWLAACERLRGDSGRFWFDRAAQATHLGPWSREPAGERGRMWEALRRWADRG
jgi:NAD(P)-dependent dehydrogenase (short-subunit alcohol dehydrogenase family)